MALLDDVKVALRLSGDAMDPEVSALVAASRRDMLRTGVPESLMGVDGGEPDPLVTMATILYCKAHFGYDNSQSQAFASSYRKVVIDMANAPTQYRGESS